MEAVDFMVQEANRRAEHREHELEEKIVGLEKLLRSELLGEGDDEMHPPHGHAGHGPSHAPPPTARRDTEQRASMISQKGKSKFVTVEDYIGDMANVDGILSRLKTQMKAYVLTGNIVKGGDKLLAYLSKKMHKALRKRWATWVEALINFRKSVHDVREMLGTEFVALVYPIVHSRVLYMGFRAWKKRLRRLKQGQRLRAYLTDIVTHWLGRVKPSKAAYFDRWRRVTKILNIMRDQRNTELAMLNALPGDDLLKGAEDSLERLLQGFCNLNSTGNPNDQLLLIGEPSCDDAAPCSCSAGVLVVFM